MMQMKEKSIGRIVGQTPLLGLDYLSRRYDAQVYAKAEFLNPMGSVKDRVALEMIERAFERGEIDENTVVAEATSGNTGIGLAGVCAARGLKLIVVMPESMSPERRKILRFLGAELRLTDASAGMEGTLEELERIAGSYENIFFPRQFENPDNPNAHYKTTGPEVFEAMEGDIDIFVCAVGTGGTISGTGRYLKERIPKLRIVALEPAGSPFLSQGRRGSHSIEGIGAGFLPATLDMSLIDDIVTIEDEEAMQHSRLLARETGLFAGISSGANLAGVEKVLSSYGKKGARVLTILPDSADRYLSTRLFDI